ncbi:MAG: HNH endonuclease [Puniceicoccaceae bacterium]|nr:MAG: HNH endonuclease [Puniceicoccaceae bacterium]
MSGHAFKAYLYSNSLDTSRKASSYLKALEWLPKMLARESYGFEDCIDIYSVDSIQRLHELREQVLQEQKKGPESPWVHPDISASYLGNYYCSAALAALIEFQLQNQYSQQVFRRLEANPGDEAAAAQALDFEPEYPAYLDPDPKSKEGKDRIRSAKTRIGQQTFHDMIFRHYQNRCCLTGLDLPQVNRASHIIGWAERKDTRMDPRNGLCLSATYDAAFDRKLITFDEDYRLVCSKTIRQHVPSESVRTYFLDREGDAIERPRAFAPLQAYLEEHRKGGDF